MSHNLSIKNRAKILSLEEIFLSDENRIGIDTFLEEYEFIDALNKYNLPIDHKIMLHGATGCGKTATAQAIAMHLNKKIITLNLAEFVSSKLGETAKNLARVFRSAYLDDSVLFIDEFDFIGKTRDYEEKDNGEMKRVVNTLLQQIDSLRTETILIAATNYIDVIDTALLRRFQLNLCFEAPQKEQLDAYYNEILSKFPIELLGFIRKYNISYAEAQDYVFQKVKANIIRIEKNKK